MDKVSNCSCDFSLNLNGFAVIKVYCFLDAVLLANWGQQIIGPDCIRIFIVLCIALVHLLNWLHSQISEHFVDSIRLATRNKQHYESFKLVSSWNLLVVYFQRTIQTATSIYWCKLLHSRLLILNVSLSFIRFGLRNKEQSLNFYLFHLISSIYADVVVMIQFIE